MLPRNLMEDLKNNRAPFLVYVKLCASFQSHRWIQTGVTVRKRQIWVAIGDFLPCDVKIWQMTLKNNATTSFVFHFIDICRFKMEIQPGNAKFGSNSVIFPRVTLKFDGWPWKTIEYLFYATSSFVHHFIAICQFKMELQSGNVKFGSKSAIFCPVWPWNLTDDLEKQ